MFDLVLRRPETSATFFAPIVAFCHRAPNAVRSDSVRRPIGFRSPSDRIANAARRLMLRDRACVTTIIYIKLLLSGKQLFTLILFCCSVFYSNIY